MAGEIAEKRDLFEIDIQRIMDVIPHRYPFVMVDRLVDVERGISATGIKNVTINEPFFQGHFPGKPVMPGVLLIESMAQTAAVLVVESLGDDAFGKLVYFMTIANARFRRPVVPGDQIQVHVAKQRKKRNVWKFKGECRVEDQIAAEATFSAMILDKNG